MKLKGGPVPAGATKGLAVNTLNLPGGFTLTYPPETQMVVDEAVDGETTTWTITFKHSYQRPTGPKTATDIVLPPTPPARRRRPEPDGGA